MPEPVYQKIEQPDFTPITPGTVGLLLRELRVMQDKGYGHLVSGCNVTHKSVKRWETTGRIKFQHLHAALDYLGYEICVRKKRRA